MGMDFQLVESWDKNNMLYLFYEKLLYENFITRWETGFIRWTY